MIYQWEQFTDKLIKYISDTNEGTIFLLMGNFAINKTLRSKLQSKLQSKLHSKLHSKLIDNNKHKIFTTKHPSPLSAYSGFFGCNVFKKIIWISLNGKILFSNNNLNHTILYQLFMIITMF
jgi:uracil-DNA glycosylase